MSERYARGDKHRLRVDLAYGWLGWPLAVLGLPFYFYMPNYWFEHWSVSLTAIGTALFLTRLVDMVTDPLVGFYSDRWLQRIGRLRQIQLGALILLVGFWPLFFPFDAWFQSEPFGYLVVWSLLAFLGWTLVAVPYQALVSQLTHQKAAKTRLTSFREGFGLLGVMLALSLPVMLSASPTSPEVFAWLYGLLVLGLAVGVFWQAWQLSPVVRMTERLRHQVSQPPARIHLSTLWRQHPWVFRIMPSYFLNNLANAFPATLFMFFVGYALGLEDQAGVLLAVFFVSGLAGLPFWFWVSKKVGKAQAWAFSMVFSAVSFSGLIWVDTGDYTGYLLICILTGWSLGADLALPSSLQVDLVQKLEAQSVEAAGTLFGVWGLLTKLAIALSIGIALPLLDALDLEAGSPAAVSALWWLYAVVPVGLKGLAVWWLWRKGHR
ncbi:MAG: MFS transporter [Hydrogenovibrio sp.]